MSSTSSLASFFFAQLHVALHSHLQFVPGSPRAGEGGTESISAG